MQTYHAEMGRTMDLIFLDEDLSVGRLNPLTPSFRKRMLEERGIPTEDSFCGEYRTFLRRIEGLSPEDSCYVWCSKDPYELTGFALASTYLPPNENRFSFATVVCCKTLNPQGPGGL